MRLDGLPRCLVWNWLRLLCMMLRTLSRVSCLLAGILGSVYGLCVQALHWVHVYMHDMIVWLLSCASCMLRALYRL
jgi:hypothetical protein